MEKVNLACHAKSCDVSRSVFDLNYRVDISENISNDVLHVNTP